MLSYFKDFLLNIFIIGTLFVLYPHIHQTQSRTAMYRFLLYFLFSAALIATMSFPINLNGLNYDFRSIPLVIGSLYGGWPICVMLYITLFVYRFFMGYPSGVVYGLSLLPSMIFVILFLRRYEHMSLSQKIAVSVLLCTLIKLITFTIYLTVTQDLGKMLSHPIDSALAYVVQGFIAGLSVYVIEFLKHYNRMQEEFLKSEKMKIVGDIAASVAHEIRNPLTTVRGFIHLFGTANLSQEKKDAYKKLCFEELDRAEFIIADYLSLAKPDPEHIEKINVQDEMMYLSNVLSTYASYNNIEIFVDTSNESALYTIGDRYKFRQALINICKNSIEAMPGGGVLKLRADKHQEGVVMVIRDSGAGMTQDQIKRLGTPYYSTKEKGTGLGTMVSFNVIKKMHGKIDIKSELGKGTEFVLTLPAS